MANLEYALSRKISVCRDRLSDMRIEEKDYAEVGIQSRPCA